MSGLSVTEIACLPQELLDWQAVVTHVHTAGNSSCSGQQTASDVAAMASALGFKAVYLNEHTGNPGAPYRVQDGGSEISLLRRAREELEASDLPVPVYFGLECNTVVHDQRAISVPFTMISSFSLDMSDEAITSLHPRYVIGSLHGDAASYKKPSFLMMAIEMLCKNPLIHTLGHITRYVGDVKIDWHEVALMARDTGTAVELNLNQWFKECQPKNKPNPADDFGVKHHRSFYEAIADSGAMFVIGADIHNAGMWPTANPQAGWETSVESVIAYHEFLAACGIRRSEVLNSDANKFARWFKIE